MALPLKSLREAKTMLIPPNNDRPNSGLREGNVTRAEVNAAISQAKARSRLAKTSVIKSIPWPDSYRRGPTVSTRTPRALSVVTTPTVTFTRTSPTAGNCSPT